MAFIKSKKVYAILMNSDEGKDIVEQAPKLSDDELENKINDFFDKDENFTKDPRKKEDFGNEVIHSEGKYKIMRNDDMEDENDFDFYEDNKKVGSGNYTGEFMKKIKEARNEAPKEDNKKSKSNELTSVSFENEDFKDQDAKEFWDNEWKVGLYLQKTNPNKFRNWVNDMLEYAETDFKEGYIKEDIKDMLLDIKVNGLKK